MLSLSQFTFVSMTYNLWGDWHPDDRVPAIRALFELRPPDLLATQELRGWSRDLIDAALPGHDRVVDDFGGWEKQSNLWWRRDLFELVEHGASDVGILSPDARLFWVRLRTKADPSRMLIFSTAHLTWPGHPDERADGVNRRADQAARIVTELDRLTGDEPCIFTVDINDIGAPLWALGNGGFLDSFSSLGRHSPVTHPVLPLPHQPALATHLSPLASPQKAIDWQFHRGPLASRCSEVVEFFHAGNAPSDHRPVASTFTLLQADDGPDDTSRGQTDPNQGVSS